MASILGIAPVAPDTSLHLGGYAQADIDVNPKRYNTVWTSDDSSWGWTVGGAPHENAESPVLFGGQGSQWLTDGGPRSVTVKLRENGSGVVLDSKTISVAG